MNFRGDGRPLSATGLAAACNTLGVTTAAVWAMLSIEPRGVGFLRDRRPRVRFERHVFHRLTAGQFAAARPDLSRLLPGGYGGAGSEWLRLEAAMMLDSDAALMSAAWGIGQVMGGNYAVAGFPTAPAMIASMVPDEDAQLAAAAAFVVGSDLAPALQQQDLAAFARGYSGPDLVRNEYAPRLLAAMQRYLAVLPDLTVRAAQIALFYLGFKPGPIDGFVGPRTRDAVMALQRQRGLPVTGELRGSLAATLIAEAWP